MCGTLLRSVLLLLTCIPVTSGQGLSNVPFATYAFGVSLNTGLNNQLFTLFIVKEFEGKVIQSDPITREQFVLQAQGAVPSKANPLNINLFRKFEVDLCLPLGEDTIGRYLLDCEVFDHLWKLRFWEYPYKLREGQHPGKGWAETRTAPSPRQLLLLTDFGMLQVGDLAYGENAFRLLHDVGDSAWVDNYRKGY
ncbi:MAG: hypothetical protein KDC00_04215 [Flavobacteriales bacterium]|nr:hypothetical protein [Flavobacteriales bacterium]